VEALEGRVLPTAYVVTTAKDILGDTTPGEVTLRDALTALDGTPSGNATAVGTATNSITFAIPGSGPQEIDVGGDASTVNQPLPDITRPVFLDGWSQGGPGYLGPPLIVLNGTHAWFLATGLTLQAGSDGSTVRGFAVQQFYQRGIAVIGASGNLIAGNYVGTDASGAVAMDNRGAGILLAGGAMANTVGGTAAADANVISGNLFDGLDITDPDTTGNVVLGNLIGTDVTGTGALANVGNGLSIGASANTVGGTASGAGNVISANHGQGVAIGGSGTSGNAVLGNLIGTDATGTKALGNGIDGVHLDPGAVHNTVGGPGARNVISANGFQGVYLGSGTSGNVVAGNLIGTDISGTQALGNGSDGVHLDGGAAHNTVGGSSPGAGNVISGNRFQGVYLGGSGTNGNVVLGNLIGTDRRGTGRLGNASIDVIFELGAARNTVGGTAPGSGNTIAFSGKGVVLADGTTAGNSLLGNRIFGNRGPGIDINDDGPTPNGRNPRALPNDGQNTPVITALTLHSISGRLSSTPRTRFRIEFFATPAGGRADQGQTFLGFLNVTPNGAGAVSFTAPVAGVPPGTVVTATATNRSTSDTSEFSPAGTQLLVISEPVIAFSTGWQAVTLSAQVFFGGAPVTGGVVVFRVAGIPGAVTGKVNANGVATVTFVVPPMTSPGKYVITATYLGTGAVPAAVGDGFLSIALPYYWLGRRGL
jgi:hypothetical protein